MSERLSVEASRKSGRGHHSERLGARQGKQRPHPLFFVSVASKGLSSAASLLFATLAGRFISVAAKGLMGEDCWRESNWLVWDDSGGLRRTARRAPIGGWHPPSGRDGIYDRQACGGQAEDRCPNNRETIAYRYSMSMITCKWFVCLGIGERGSWEGK